MTTKNASKTSSVTVIADAKALNTLIASIKSRGAKLDSDILKAGVSAAAHVLTHRNSTPMSNLDGVMPRSARAKALVDWFNRYLPLSMDYKGKVALADVSDPVWTDAVANLDDIVQDMIRHPFWEKAEKGEKDALTFDAVLSYVKRKANAKDIDATLKAQLDALVAAGEALVQSE